MHVLPSIEGNQTDQWLKGWAVSLTFHLLVVAAAVTVVPKITHLPQKELFTWDVNLVEAPRQQTAPEPSPTRAAVSKPVPPQANPVAPAPPEPVETSQPIRRQIETRPILETVQREVRQEVVEMKTIEPQRVEDKKAVSEPAAVLQPSPVVSKSETVVAEKPTEMGVVPVAEQPAPTSTHVAAPGRSIPAVEQPIVAQPPQPFVSASAPSAPGPPQRTIEEEVPAHAPASASVESQAPVARAPESQGAMVSKPVSAANADHGWLAELLHQRIRELRQYPRVARMNGWQGKVVLRVVIKDDGHLHDVLIVKSSGFDALDQAAVEAVRRACPLKLHHELGRPSVVMHVPVSYTLAN